MAAQKIASDLRKFYAYQVFSNLDFARGIFVLYLLERGITGSQIGLMQSLLFLTSLLAELPTGLFADKYGRKLSVVLGLIICALVPVGIVMSSSFAEFLVLFVFLGIGYPMERGADTALLYSRLESEGDAWAKDFQRIGGRARAFRYSSLAVATMLGGFLQTYGWVYVYGAVSFCVLLAIIAISTFPDVHLRGTTARATKINTRPKLGPALKSLILDQKNRHLVVIVGIVALVTAAATPLFIFAQALFKDYGLGAKEIGFCISAGLVVNSLFSAFAHFFERKSLKLSVLPFLIILSVVILVIQLQPPLYVAILLFMASQASSAVLGVQLSNAFIQDVDQRIRATGLSLIGFVGAIALTLSNLAVGSLIDASTIHNAIGWLGLLPLAATLLLFWYKAKETQRAP